MKALSIKQPWSELVARGKKKIEYRTWSIGHRGPLLIVASKSRQDEDCAEERIPADSLVYGAAVCIVDLVDVTGTKGDFEWHFRNPRRVKPLPVTGYASIYTVEDSRIVLESPPAPEPVPALAKTLASSPVQSRRKKPGSRSAA